MDATRVKLARDLGRGRRVIDEDGAFGHAGEGAIRAHGHGTHVIVIADASEDDLAILRGLARRRRARASVFLHPGVGLGGRSDCRP